MVVWTVSDGRRGRRWREVRADGGGAVVSSLLLETDPADQFLHAELATAAGLLTLHPETDGTLHGNVVTVDGVRHVAGLRWSEDGALLVDGSAIALTAAAHALRERTIVGSSMRLVVAHVTPGLDVAISTAEVERLGPDLWRIEGREIKVDSEGVPAFAGARTWPLELPSHR